MVAKMKAKKDGRRRYHSWLDWAQVEERVMQWCLRGKWLFNDRFRRLLAATGDRPIEESRRDRVWGAVATREGVLEGENRLGGPPDGPARRRRRASLHGGRAPAHPRVPQALTRHPARVAA